MNICQLYGRSSKKGFTVIELLIVIAIVGILGALSIPRFLHVLKARQAADCALNRINTQNAEWQYIIDSGQPSQSIDELVQKKYIPSYPQCTAGGVYIWINEATEGNPFRNLGCSYHYFPLTLASATTTPATAATPITPIGSTFTEISSNIIQLLDSYYEKNGKYARSWGDYTFTDIGLDPSLWQNALNGIIYKPVGNRLNISPDTGYVFYVQDMKGTVKTLTPELNWNLVYSLKDKTWYYHNTSSGNEINIATLKVEKK